MNKIILASVLAAIPACAMAQTAVDGMSISQSDLRGTARYMSMAGAFTALGGDISSFNQNPAGLGIYRSSEIALSLDLDMLSAKSAADGFSDKQSQTRFACNNFGYAGAIALNSEVMPFFNWGVSYSRQASFDRTYGGRLTQNLQTSYTNLVAENTTTDGFDNLTLADQKGYNPFFDSSAPWTSILFYNAYGINPTAPGANSYTGLYDYNGTAPGTADYTIREKGHVDEYSINFAGNVSNLVYWGLGFGITDLNFKQTAYYGEAFGSGALVPNSGEESYTTGSASWGMTNWKHIYGTGFNVKFGLIFKPINELRIGLAVHTPTWYSLTTESQATVGYDYNSPNYTDGNKYSGNYTSEADYVNWKMNAPWRLSAGIAGVIAGRAILSLDYEYKGFGSMTFRDANGYDYNDLNGDVKNYYQATNTIRLGAEYRVTPGFSVRAGYSCETSPTQKALLDPEGSNATYVFTSNPDDTATQPSYSLTRSTQYVTCGLGYRYKAFSADLAYVHRTRKADYHAFTDYNETEAPHYLVTAPKAKVSENNNSLILTLAYRF
ncbi:MAG: hypothetical protein K2L26_09440 [Duncaniella sp.]|nr:hypothetical protein [Duncaniella sp.]